MSKYRAVPKIALNVKFHSTGEANRFLQLNMMQTYGKIQDLALQVKFPLIVNGITVCTYVCDFQYVLPSGEVIVEDFKGYITPIYRLKKKLFTACYGFEITETRA